MLAAEHEGNGEEASDRGDGLPASVEESIGESEKEAAEPPACFSSPEEFIIECKELCAFLHLLGTRITCKRRIAVRHRWVPGV